LNSSRANIGEKRNSPTTERRATPETMERLHFENAGDITAPFPKLQTFPAFKGAEIAAIEKRLEVMRRIVDMLEKPDLKSEGRGDGSFTLACLNLMTRDIYVQRATGRQGLRAAS
jgi:hypothetical protein